MALFEGSFYSWELGMDTQLQLIIPESRIERRERESKKYRVLYCLHGHSRDHSTYSRYGILEQLLGNSNVIAVIPNGHRSFYVDEYQGYRYFTYLTEELPILLGNLFPISENKEDHYICGFSMGGFGALHAALKKPDYYAGAAIYSVASDPFECMDILYDLGLGKVPDLQSNMERVFGPRDAYHDSKDNLDWLIDHTENYPIIYHACGTEDVLYSQNQRLRSHMEKQYPAGRYTYYEGKGFHDWTFWNEQLKKTVEFFHLV